ncbi:MAG TPA: methyl-accepting chemotaxis protein [Accumulibacter sp.]|uniref:Methyl-accepting chemotaxis protein 4 n=1 Tax=Candidatus Accumulibacter cognatus TaxID=2954383 RepID=A0A080MFY0_9PROT|nr:MULTISPECIES: methyl-accepting chemotaxis protein [Candidatus Accumulibacter]MCC2869938.1 methyl-accepting chemotaxis protein [Candidatus Accumulibacter phosphatis]KFB76159.1 MAG: Methyl-accepting chemotaxis protein 4 [Candidatus Accumulibacter cognatus]MBN8518365.1 type IV pili methyl-accepting chemotaxis transducer N-terminal domain-containing protein [Accumulibacter sp.]MBO3712507.1 type IV pili methyl-accepting chemotaxis transducer N-terminal domain-containing protein [Accumulibacter sp
MKFKPKLPAFLSRMTTAASETLVARTVIDPSEPVSKGTIPLLLPLLNRFPVVKQLQILGGCLVLVMLVIAVLAYRDDRQSAYNTAYIATAGEMRMLSQRLAKASSLALLGDTVAFKQLLESRDSFANYLERLTTGGELAATRVPPSPASVQGQLQTLTQIWEKTDKNASRLLEMEKNLVSLGKDIATINDKNPQLLELSEQIAALKLQGSASVREIAAANLLVMLTQRIAKNASALLLGDAIDPEIAFLLGKDTNTFRDTIQALTKGSDTLRISATTDADTRQKLNALDSSFAEYRKAVGGILGNMQKLIIAKQAGSQIFRDSEELLDATYQLAQAYHGSFMQRTAYGMALLILILLAISLVFLLGKTYLAESQRQTEQAEQRRQETELLNRQNQDAILRLMNELGDLADGDLTVTATVSEDITGAIADSINYTIEELRVLVGRINDAAGRVTQATEMAQQTSAELLAAAERQAAEIKAAGQSVLTVASSMTNVSGDAKQSATVARQSLMAAGKGAQAVEDSIKGMNKIREQIQETSKRIKRLGESSQEIGEIVELISDITEQTNVLALNAAIQAASAGEAGRGFTVVAEEVQRLAERSGEATKQIGAIVRTIQTDTQDTVSAMEESTRGVVEGARLSDAAGQALAEIGEVSRTLTALIENISGATRQAADSATKVARKMQEILLVTGQTTAGTEKTATAIGELAGLATELKGSVAGFKVS